MVSSFRKAFGLLLALTLMVSLTLPGFASTQKLPEEKPFPKTKVLTDQDDTPFGILKINGPEDSAIYVKIYETDANKTTVAKKPTKTLFLRAGKSLTIDMPRGFYLLRYCTGTKWYGEEEMFGTKDASYGEAETVLRFMQSDEGYEITLRFMAHGNLPIHGVPKDTF